MERGTLKNVVSIAGVDPSGGAGVLADVKVMSALGTYGMGVIAALTAQNTQAVTGVLPVPAPFVRQQLDAIFADIDVHAVKIGMLGAKDVMQEVAQTLTHYKAPKIVLDTVMVAKSGDRLMPDDAVAFFRETLLPVADLITPNVPEAEVLLEHGISTQDDLLTAAKELHALTGKHAAVYMKGGHLSGESVIDLFYDGKVTIVMRSKRVHTRNTHGTGCSLSSALAALWARNDDILTATQQAHNYIAQAIAASDRLNVGHGHGPIHHFVRMDESD